MIKKTIKAGLVPETETILYTVPDGKVAEITCFTIANNSSGNKSIYLDYYKKDGDELITIMDGRVVDSGSIMTIGGHEGFFICMDVGDAITVDTSNNSDFSIFMSYIEHNRIVQGG